MKLKPGTYKNKRGETLKLVKFDDMLTDNNDNFYLSNGRCLFWSEYKERFYMNTDPKSDLDIDGSK